MARGMSKGSPIGLVRPSHAARARRTAFDTARIAWRGSQQLPNPQIAGDWGTQAWVHFLEGMGATLKPEQLAQLDAAYRFTGTANGEIAMRWYPLALRSGYLAGSVLAAATVALTGPIGFVGLVVPHLIRPRAGGDDRIVMPCAFLLGGVLLATCDAIGPCTIDCVSITLSSKAGLPSGPFTG